MSCHEPSFYQHFRMRVLLPSISVCDVTTGKPWYVVEASSDSIDSTVFPCRQARAIDRTRQSSICTVKHSPHAERAWEGHRRGGGAWQERGRVCKERARRWEVAREGYLVTTDPDAHATTMARQQSQTTKHGTGNAEAGRPSLARDCTCVLRRKRSRQVMTSRARSLKVYSRLLSKCGYPLRCIRSLYTDDLPNASATH